jgi:hypothetical protein
MVISPSGSIFLFKVGRRTCPMSDYFWLREAQFERIKPYFPLPHGVPVLTISALSAELSM